MSFRIDLWEVEENRLKTVPATELDFERRLEDWLADEPRLSGMDVLIIGRQLQTSHGGRIDLLGIDCQANTVLFELKKGRTPRDVVAQVLDYASWVKELTFADLDAFCVKYCRKGLAAAYRDRFDDSLPDIVNSAHTLVVVAAELDESSERIVEYLAEEAGLAINVVFFNAFNLGERELLGRAWLRDPVNVEEKRESKRQAPWSGYWFVNVGEGEHRNWDDCRKYGFLSAGQGERYSRPLTKLRLGDKIFAYMKGLGYVGYGTVTNEAKMIRDATIDGTPIVDLSLSAENPLENLDDPIHSEWVVGIDWAKAVPREKARTFEGVFANQNIVCKLRHPETVQFLEKEFSVATDQ